MNELILKVTMQIMTFLSFIVFMRNEGLKRARFILGDQGKWDSLATLLKSLGKCLKIEKDILINHNLMKLSLCLTKVSSRFLEETDTL